MLQAGRRFLKQAADRNLRSLVAWIRPRGLALTITDFHPWESSPLLVKSVRLDTEAMEGSASPGAQRMDRPQIFRRLDLTGGMPLKTQARVLPVHSDAVVDTISLGAALVNASISEPWRPHAFSTSSFMRPSAARRPRRPRSCSS